MATLREIALKDIDFSGKESLFTQNYKKLYPDEFKFTQDVAPLIRKCIELQDFLFRNPSIPYKATFITDSGNNLFIVSDKRKCMIGKSTVMKLQLKYNNASDITLLDNLLAELSDVPKFIEKFTELDNFLSNHHIIPLITKIENIDGDTFYILKERRSLKRFTRKRYVIDIMEDRKENIEKIETVLSVLNNVKTMKKFAQGIIAGAGLLKLIFEGEPYVRKYVNSDGKARFWHVIACYGKTIIAGVVCVSFIGTLIFYGPTVAIPLLGLILNA